MQSLSPQEQVLITRANMARQAEMLQGQPQGRRGDGLLALSRRLIALVWRRQVSRRLQRMRAASGRRISIR